MLADSRNTLGGNNMLKYLWFPVMMVCIPIDYVIWNVVFTEHGSCSFKKCASDGWKKWSSM